MDTQITLTDLVRAAAGWPVDLAIVAYVLDAADRVLSADGGRDCKRPLTDDEIVAMGFSRR